MAIAATSAPATRRAGIVAAKGMAHVMYCGENTLPKSHTQSSAPRPPQAIAPARPSCVAGAGRRATHADHSRTESARMGVEAVAHHRLASPSMLYEPNESVAPVAWPATISARAATVPYVDSICSPRAPWYPKKPAIAAGDARSIGTKLAE